MSKEDKKQTGNKSIDTCVAYINSKDCYYLAKEGLITFYSSLTGRKNDYRWHKQSVAQTLRIITATHLAITERVVDRHLIAAFQELDRVFEVAVKSRHKVAEGVFNYNEHCGYDLGDDIAHAIVDSLLNEKFHGVLIGQVLTIFNRVQDSLEADIGAKDGADYIRVQLEQAGYEYKVNSKRVLFEGSKQRAALYGSTKPADIKKISSMMGNQITLHVLSRLE